MGLREDLRSDDDATRLDACRRATSEGALELVPLLLDLALRDRADVKVMGGMAEMWSRVSHAAAGALAALLERLGETESAARAVGTDLQHDDEAVGEFLYYLGKPAEAVRRELETHPEPRVRLRALKADGAAARRDLHELVDAMAAAVKARGYEVPMPSPATDADTTTLELSGGAARAPDSADVDGTLTDGSSVTARSADSEGDGTASAGPTSGTEVRDLARGPSRRAVASPPGVTLALAEGETSATLTLRLACGTCGAHARVQLPVRYQSMDDDRFAARETTYQAGGWMNCPACAAAWCVETMLDLVEPRGAGERTLEWCGPGRQDGARVASRPAE